jgi:hypothetical protein
MWVPDRHGLTAALGPLAAPKSSLFIADILGPRTAEREDLLRRSGITEESYWLQLEPDAKDILIVVTGDQTA